MHFYNEYVDSKSDEEINVDSVIKMTKAIGCIVVGFFFAYSRAILLEKYY